MLTFGEIRRPTGPIVKIAGLPPSSDEFAEIVNEAGRRFARRGDWSGTVVPLYSCIRNGCVVWPRYVGQVRKINICNQTIPVRNMWGDFLDFDPRGWKHSYWWGWLGQNTRMLTQARVPTYATIPNGWTTVRAYIDSPLDANKTVTLFGEDSNGQTLMDRGVGPWTNGVRKNLVAQTTSPGYTEWTGVRNITRVSKDATNGPVRLYATDGTNMIDLAVYEPSETNPDYLRSELRLPQCGDCATGRAVIALVKLQFIPVSVDSDLVIVNNIEALKLMVQSIKFEEAGDNGNARTYEANAIREGNMQLYDEDNENEAVPVNVDAMGGTFLGQQRCF